METSPVERVISLVVVSQSQKAVYFLSKECEIHKSAQENREGQNEGKGVVSLLEFLHGIFGYFRLFPKEVSAKC